MAFGLPSAQEMRDYLISQGVDPVIATERANVAARQNAAQAARTSALSILAGAAPARAAGTAIAEGVPAAGRAAMNIAERVAAAPRNVWEYLTVPRGVIRNPTTGARIPTRNAATGRMERTPDYFLPGQQLAQGVAGATALGGGAAGTAALMDRPSAVPNAFVVPDRLPAEYGDVYEPVSAPGVPDRLPPEYGDPYERVSATRSAVQTARAPSLRDRQAAAAAMLEGSPAPMRRPQEGGLAKFFSFKDPYEGKSARDLYAEANKMQSSGDEAGAHRLIGRAMQMPQEEGMATGGAAKPHKDAALHKALDIISHMLGRH